MSEITFYNINDKLRSFAAEKVNIILEDNIDDAIKELKKEDNFKYIIRLAFSDVYKAAIHDQDKLVMERIKDIKSDTDIDNLSDTDINYLIHSMVVISYRLDKINIVNIKVPEYINKISKFNYIEKNDLDSINDNKGLYEYYIKTLNTLLSYNVKDYCNEYSELSENFEELNDIDLTTFFEEELWTYKDNFKEEKNLHDSSLIDINYCYYIYQYLSNILINGKKFNISYLYQPLKNTNTFVVNKFDKNLFEIIKKYDINFDQLYTNYSNFMETIDDTTRNIMEENFDITMNEVSEQLLENLADSNDERLIEFSNYTKLLNTIQEEEDLSMHEVLEYYNFNYEELMSYQYSIDESLTMYISMLKNIYTNNIDLFYNLFSEIINGVNKLAIYNLKYMEEKKGSFEHDFIHIINHHSFEEIINTCLESKDDKFFKKLLTSWIDYYNYPNKDELDNSKQK